MTNNQRGFTLLEVMVSLFIFSVVIAGMSPAFVAQLQQNTASEVKTEAIMAAQQVLDTLRLQDISGLPTSGAGGSTTIVIGDRSYVVTPTYCAESSFCTSIVTRHIGVTVTYAGVLRYETETVFTQLR